MPWRWIAQRWVISAFVLFHLSALMMWTMPNCVIKERCQAPYYYYMLPTGLWQWWAIFAPDPIRSTLVLNAEVLDAQGMRHVYEFPRIGELTWWQKYGHYRNPKFTANMLNGEFKGHRPFTARHAVRELIKQGRLREESFPILVSLYTDVKDSPPPGTGVSDPMATPRVEVVERFEFATIKEVRP
jgi:hypothetical protein